MLQILRLLRPNLRNYRRNSDLHRQVRFRWLRQPHFRDNSQLRHFNRQRGLLRLLKPYIIDNWR